MKTKVIIIGGNAKREHFETPDPRDRVEIWGLNAIRFHWVPWWSRMFNLHLYDRLKSHDWPVQAEREWAMDHVTVPFYVLDAWPEHWLPKQIIFPGDKLMEMPRGSYHCGSFDWLVAFAIHLGNVREIEFHGVGLERAVEGGEPISSRACLEYWCGYATAKGIKISTTEDCALFKFYHVVKSNAIYGYDDTPLVEDRTDGG